MMTINEAPKDPGGIQTVRYELPDTGVIRAGQSTEIGFKLASPFTIMSIDVCEGFRVDLFAIGAKEFDIDACQKLAFAALNTLPTDGLRLRVTNVTEQDRQFEGTIILGPSTVIGWKGPAPVAGATSRDPRLIAGDAPPAPLPSGQNYGYGPAPSRASNEPDPAQYQAMVDDQYARLYPTGGPGSRDVRAFQAPHVAQPRHGAPPPRQQTQGHTLSKQGAATYNGEMREGTPVTPGADEIAVCLTRTQIQKILVLLNGQYLPPFQLTDVRSLFERAVA